MMLRKWATIAISVLVAVVIVWLAVLFFLQSRSSNAVADDDDAEQRKTLFRLMHYSSNGKRAIDVLRSLSSASIDVYSLTAVATNDELQLDQGKSLLTRLPHVSSEDAIHLHSSKSYAGSYYDVFSGSGEALFVNKYTGSLYSNEPLIWSDRSSSYLRARQPLTTILTGSDAARKHRRNLIIAPCLLGKVRCALFTYRYDAFSDTRLNSATALNALISVLNYAKAYIEKNDVTYYVINADSHVFSVAWKQILQRIFPDDYTSPSFAENFITCNYTDGGLYTTDFVLVSRSFVPPTATLRFNLRDLTFASSDQRYAILVEISNAASSAALSEYDEKTRAIMRISKNWQTLHPHVNREPETFDVSGLDFGQVASLLHNNESKRLIPLNHLLH